MNYSVEKDRLDEDDWHDHMPEKPWVNIDDFYDALAAAKDMLAHGII